jgi:hypothetical protein
MFTSIYFDKEKTPLAFRNFLTFSFSEDMKDEFYVDNEFYVSKITDMVFQHFEYFKYKIQGNTRTFDRDEHQQVIKVNPHIRPTRFYKSVSRSYGL